MLPNLVTLLALSMGLTAIRYAVEGKFETAVLAVIAAAVLDGLDGRLARALKGTTRFGAELDSLTSAIGHGSLEISRQLGYSGAYPRVAPPSEVLAETDGPGRGHRVSAA